MGIVKSDIAISLDGFVAGSGPEPRESRSASERHPPTSAASVMFEAARREPAPRLDAIVDAGAFIMGRNMFGPGRGDWDLDWRGWWGDDPPYHGPVFVLAHHAREPLEMEGGTTFHFVTDGVESALRQAREAAGDRDISIAGGASTVNQFLAAGLHRRAAAAHLAADARRGRAAVRRRAAADARAGVGAARPRW